MATRPTRVAPGEDRRSPAVELVWPGKSAAAAADAPAARFRAVERYRPAAREPEPPAWQNRLLQGENLTAMRSLLPEFEGRLDLIYLDPPFATGNAFDSQIDVGDLAEGPNAVSARAYDDRWGRGRERWFGMLYERLEHARRLLAETGTLYLHLDWWAGHHARVLLDEIFGEENSLGEIVWAYGSPSGGRAAGQKLIKAHDILYVFARSYGRHRYKTVYLPYSDKYLRDWFKFADPDGRRYRKRWRRDAQGRSYVEKQYLDASRGVPASTVWTDIQQVYADPRAYKSGMTSEVTGYPTQKPVRLLERILEISSEPGDLVADFFCGSGTTLVAAERLDRRWIGCDESALAIQATRKRLLLEKRRAGFEVARAPGLADAPGPLAGATLRVGTRLSGRQVLLHVEALEQAAAPALPRTLCAKIREPLDLVDSWAVDWEFDGETFQPTWFAHRTRKDRTLPLDAWHSYDRLGGQRIAVAAWDPFGNALRWEWRVPHE